MYELLSFGPALALARVSLYYTLLKPLLLHDSGRGIVSGIFVVQSCRVGYSFPSLSPKIFVSRKDVRLTVGFLLWSTGVIYVILLGIAKISLQTPSNPRRSGDSEEHFSFFLDGWGRYLQQCTTPYSK
jgi:hypothetical protein